MTGVAIIGAGDMRVRFDDGRLATRGMTGSTGAEYVVVIDRVGRHGAEGIRRLLVAMFAEIRRRHVSGRFTPREITVMTGRTTGKNL